jgi:hypothetical protein
VHGSEAPHMHQVVCTPPERIYQTPSRARLVLRLPARPEVVVIAAIVFDATSDDDKDVKVADGALVYCPCRRSDADVVARGATGASLSRRGTACVCECLADQRCTFTLTETSHWRELGSAMPHLSSPHTYNLLQTNHLTPQTIYLRWPSSPHNST